MTTSSIDKLAAAPKYGTKMKRSVSDMAHEIGWKQPEAWMYKLAERIPKEKADESNIRTLRAELRKRLDPDYYTESMPTGSLRIKNTSYSKEGQPSPISILRYSKRIQKRITAPDFRYTELEVSPSSTKICGLILKPDNRRDATYIEIDGFGSLVKATEMAMFVSDVTDLRIRHVQEECNKVVPASRHGHYSLHKSVFFIRRRLLVPQS